VLKRFGLLSSVLFLATAGPVHANESASITLSLSVYIEPEAYESPESGADLGSHDCTDALATTDPTLHDNCQDGNTLYAWRRASSALMLTIAPI
jgi:hypothetical protein